MTADPAALAEALAADLCQQICALVGEPRLLVPGEVQALLLASPEFARLIAAERAEALRKAADRMPAFHDRDAPEWAITSACAWLRKQADGPTEWRLTHE